MQFTVWVTSSGSEIDGHIVFSGLFIEIGDVILNDARNRNKGSRNTVVRVSPVIVRVRFRWGFIVCVYVCVCECACAHPLAGSSSERRVWAVLIQQQGNGPVMVAMVNMAPCRVLAVPYSPPSPPLLLSTVLLHAGFSSNTTLTYFSCSGLFLIFFTISAPSFLFLP